MISTSLGCKETSEPFIPTPTDNQKPLKKAQPTPSQKILKAQTPTPTQSNKKGLTQKPTSTQTQQSQPTVPFPFDIDLKDANGKLHKSKKIFKLNGKPTVLMFWLSTCAPCHMKLNAIKPLYPQWREEADFNIYAISGDYTKNYAKFCKQTKTKNWEWDTYNDVNRSFRKLLPGGLNGYPQTFIFDAKGTLVYQDKRYRPGDENRLFQKIKEVCKE